MTVHVRHPLPHTASLGAAQQLYRLAAADPLGAAARHLSADAIAAAGDAGKPVATAYQRLAAIAADLASAESEAREAAVGTVRLTFKQAGIDATPDQIAKAAEPRVREHMAAARRSALAEVQTLKTTIADAVPRAPAAAGTPAAPEHESLVLQRFASLQGAARAQAIADCLAGNDDATAAALVRHPALAGVHAGTAEAIRLQRFASTQPPAVAPALLGLTQLAADTAAAFEEQLTTATAED